MTHGICLGMYMRSNNTMEKLINNELSHKTCGASGCRCFSVMSGEAAPADWQGGLNFTYRIGPGFTRSDLRVQMFVSTHLQRARVYNAFGIIEGAIEPGIDTSAYLHLVLYETAWSVGRCFEH